MCVVEVEVLVVLVFYMFCGDLYVFMSCCNIVKKLVNSFNGSMKGGWDLVYNMM